MALNIFKKENKPDKKTQKTIEPVQATSKLEDKKQPMAATGYGVLKSFYISEKATLLNGNNQYVFRVFPDANKNEIKKEVEKAYNVKVKSVKVINLPRKKRTVGRYAGFKPGLRKAIVVLREGDAITQAQP